MSVGKALLRIRQAKKLTQGDLCDAAGLAASYLSRIENDRIQPTMPTLQRIANALGVSVAEIFRVEEGKVEPPVHRCPVSSSGQCVGELIRSARGRPPRNGKIHYGPEELRLLRMADYIVLHSSNEIRDALAVVLESLVSRTATLGDVKLDSVRKEAPF